MPLRGEETRWAEAAREMLDDRDWVVPHQQGEPFLNRPPLHCWLIALTALLHGQLDLVVLRLPSLLATLFGTLITYGYARVTLSRLGAFGAAAAVATMGELLQTCRLAETDAVFIPLVSASLFVWHWGGLRSWPETRRWVLSYAIMALATLTKGLQAPIYFGAAIAAYSLCSGGWRRLFGVGHLLGMFTALAIIAAWQVPFILDQGWEAVPVVWLGQTEIRMRRWTLQDVGVHMVQFPFEVAACTMPWSALLLAYLSRSFRARLGAARPVAVFLGLAAALAFPSCWLPPQGRSRYFAPLYPCLAVLVGIVIDRCAAVEVPRRLRWIWRRYTALLAATMMLIAGGLILACVLANQPRLAAWSHRPIVAGLYATSALGLAAFVLRARRRGETRLRWGVLAIAGFMGVIVGNLLIDLQIRINPDTETAIARVRQILPQDQQLVSLRPVHHRFAYFYGKPILPLPFPSSAQDVPDDIQYFCFDAAKPEDRAAVPFAWEEVAVISMERRQRPNPQEVVVIGRRLP